MTSRRGKAPKQTPTQKKPTTTTTPQNPNPKQGNEQAPQSATPKHRRRRVTEHRRAPREVTPTHEPPRPQKRKGRNQRRGRAVTSESRLKRNWESRIGARTGSITGGEGGASASGFTGRRVGCFRIRGSGGRRPRRATPHAAEEELAEAGTAVAVADRLAGPDDIYCGA